MLRFMLRTAGFVLAAMLCLALVSAVLLPKAGGLDPSEKNIRLANTGNSHGMFAFDYSTISDDLAPNNFAMESQSLVYDEKLIRSFAHHFAADGAVLFVPVDLTALWYEETEDADFNAKNERYLPIIGARNMRFSDTFETILYRYFYVLTCMDRWTGTLFAISDAGEEKNPQLSRYSREEIGQMRSQHHLSHILAEDGTVFPLNETNVQALHNLLDLCAEKNIRPILLTTPYHEAYTRCIPDVARATMVQAVQSIADAHGVAWWDYFDAEPFHSDETLFSDTDHLSGEGSTRFMETLKARLVVEGYFTAEELG